VTVEPGVYVPERFGIRIEDMVVARSDGPDVLTKAPSELLVL
jgi:Xaa-Pro aminopeptidase